MKSILILSTVLFLTACASTKENISVEKIKVDKDVMIDCNLEKYEVKAGMSIFDLAEIILKERKLREDCSVLNDKKKAFINSVL